MQALGMIEVNSIAAGIEAGDVMLKTAAVSLVTAQPVCAGKYIVIVQGGVSEVKSSVEAGKAIGNTYLVDSIVIPNVHSQVFSAIACATEPEKLDSIGVIETFSLTSSIMTADVAVKAANVELIEVRLGRGLGGKSYVVMTGDVSAVKHAVETARNLYIEEGLIANTIVVPSPHMDLIRVLL